MDFDQLHTFLEIVRLKSFSKAAQTCFRTQPAISAQIRQMEQELGTQLFERFEEVQVQVMRSYSSKTVQSVMDNSVDFGITQLPVQEKRLEVIPIHSDEIRLLVPPAHPFAKKTSVSAEQIAEYPLLLPKGGRTRSRINEYLDAVEDDLRISMELESSEMLKQFIIAGLGIGFMAVTNARKEIRQGALRAVRLAPLPMIRTIGLIYRKDKALPRAGLGFIEVVADFAREAQSKDDESFGFGKATRAS